MSFSRALVLTAFLLGAFAPVAGAKEVCVNDVWGRFLAPGKQDYTPRERFNTRSGEVFSYGFEGLEGEFAKVWLFLLNGSPKMKCYTEAVLLGSYEATNSRRSEGSERLYHMDHYNGGSHATLGFAGEPLSYEEMRDVALSVWN